MTEFITRVCHEEHRYEVIIKTNSEEHYHAAQAYARLLIDHQKPMTNADRIRSMRDEELATLINRIVVCHHLRNEGHCEKCPIYPARPCDTDGLLEWLKQEVSE